jgi:hypothetical protein
VLHHAHDLCPSLARVRSRALQRLTRRTSRGNAIPPVFCFSLITRPRSSDVG